MAGILGERIAELMRAQGLTQQALAKKVGVSQPTIGRLINGETKETPKLHELGLALNTTADYLLGRTDDPSIFEFHGSMEDFKAVSRVMGAPDPDVVELAEIDLRFGLGGTYVDSPAEVRTRRFSREWLRNFTHAPPEQLVWTVGTGDSMEPTIRSGEVILIDRSQQTPRFGDEIWACSYGDIGMIKRLRPMPDGTVQIHSDNQVVRPEVAADGELHVYGRVVAVVRKL